MNPEKYLTLKYLL